MKKRCSLLVLAWLILLPVRAQVLQTVDEPQYLKAEQALERMKQGYVPEESSDQRWDIFRDVFIGFMQTEEFKAMTPDRQSLIRAYTDRMNDQLTVANGASPSGETALWANGASPTGPAAARGKQQYHLAFLAAARHAQPYIASPCNVIFEPEWFDPNIPDTSKQLYRAMDKTSRDWFLKSKRDHYHDICIDGDVDRPTHLFIWGLVYTTGTRVISWPTHSTATITGPDGQPIATVNSAGSVPILVPSTTTFLRLDVASMMDGDTLEAFEHPVWSRITAVGGSRDRAAKGLFEDAIKFLAVPPARK